MMFTWDAMLVAGALLIIAWVIFYRWRLQEKALEPKRQDAYENKDEHSDLDSKLRKIKKVLDKDKTIVSEEE